MTSLRADSATNTFVSRFQICRADAAKVAVPPGAGIESVDVVGDVCQRIVAGRIDAFPDTLLLQTAEERLDDRVIPAIAFPAHAWLEEIGAAEPPPGATAALHPLSEWMIIPRGRRCFTAAASAFKTSSQ